MAATQLCSAGNAATEYPLEARYVCERCFGPLEVAYDHSALDADVAALRRRIQAGPQNIWRYADFLPLEAPARPVARDSSRVGLPAGCTPLIRADRLAERLGLRRGVGQERRRQPDALVQGPRRLRRRRRARASSASTTLACASTGNLANAVAAHGRRARAGRPTSSSRPTSRSRRSSRPASTARTSSTVSGNYDDVNRLCTELSGERELGVRERQHAPVLRRGLQDARLRDRRAARLGAARPHRRADRLRARCSRRSPRASRSGSSSGLIDGRRCRR